MNRRDDIDAKVRGRLKAAGDFRTHFYEDLRETLVDLCGDWCAATLSLDGAIHITTRRPLSKENVQQVHEKMSGHSRQNGAVPRPCFVNGQPLSRYHFDHSAPPFQQELVAPLSAQNHRVGNLFVGSFDHPLDARRQRLLRKLARALPRALRHAKYLAKRKKEAFELLAARTIEGLILCDPGMRIQYLNNAARQLLNLPSDQKIVGEPLGQLNVSYLNDFIEEARREGLLELNKIFTPMHQPSLLVGAHIELLKNSRNQKVGWMIDLRDVSKNWQNDQLRSALVLASHEMKTPLNSIKNAVELLLETSLGELNDQQKRCLHLVKDDAVRLNRLLSDILDLSRFDAGIPFLDRRREIALPILIDKAIESFQAFAQSKNIKIENQVSPTFPTFNGLRDRLQQVLANLLENGIKYTLPGGSVTLQAELDDKHLIFTVKDTGVGIPASERESIFERFKQLDNYPGGKQGFGLGLSISKEIIEAMGGKIWVESQVGVGSSFHFKIPV